jgi:predicted Zn-dependent protease
MNPPRRGCGGWLLYHNSARSKARGRPSLAVRLDPQNAIVDNGRGSVHLAKGNLDAALTDLDAAIRRDPDCTNAYGVR